MKSSILAQLLDNFMSDLEPILRSWGQIQEYQEYQKVKYKRNKEL